MLSRRSRISLFALVGAALVLIALYTYNPALPSQTKGYLKGLVAHPEEPQEDEIQRPDGEPPKKEDEPTFSNDKWFFQVDFPEYELPTFNIEKLRYLPPHNYKGPGHPTFATFYASRNATVHDPYFLAAQEIVYRLLWDEKSKSHHHPVTVFVASFVPDEQRAYFSAAGAIVRELGLRPFEPVTPGVPARLQDMFAKLEMWKQTDFSRIAYMDCDAFPVDNIDGIFNVSTESRCNITALPDADKPYANEICDYVFAGHPENDHIVNAGVMIFKPDQPMFARLDRDSKNKEGWDTGYMEQAFLSHAFARDGPFPPTLIGSEWNSFPDAIERGEPVPRIVHDKMWGHVFEHGLWATENWNAVWADMTTLYNSPEFEKIRHKDKARVDAELAHRG